MMPLDSASSRKVWPITPEMATMDKSWEDEIHRVRLGHPSSNHLEYYADPASDEMEELQRDKVAGQK